MRRAKPRYKSPRKPWESKRIKEENEIVRGYGLVNKREIWKTADKLRNWREQAKNIVSIISQEKDKHKKILLSVRKVNSPSYLVRVDDEVKFVEGFEPNTEVVAEVVQSEPGSAAPRAESTTEVKETKSEAAAQSAAEVKE